MIGEIALLIEEGRESEAIFALECAAADRHGELPDGWEKVLPHHLTGRSPILLKACAWSLIDQGKLADAKKLLSEAMRGFARQTAAADLLSALALHALVNLRLGGAIDASTGLRFLSEELNNAEVGDELPPEMLFALGKGGFIVGLAEHERLRLLEQAAVLYMSRDNLKRSLEAVFEWARLNERLESPNEKNRLFSLINQRSKWDLRYSAHKTVIDLFRSDAIAAAACESTRGALSAYYQLLLELTACRKNYPIRGIQEVKSEIEKDFIAEVDLHAELHVAFLDRMLRMGKRDEAMRAHHELEALLSIGLPPEYERLWRRYRDELRKLPAQASVREADEAHPAWHIHCFGGFQMERQGLELQALGWKRKKAQELFLFLLLRPGFSAPKEQATDALFGEADPDKSSNQLYVIIHEAKRVLQTELGWQEGAYIRDGVIRLPDQYIEEVDVEKYIALVRVADQLQSNDPELSAELYERASELYQPLLPDIQFIDWLDRFRGELEQKQLRVLKQLYIISLRNNELERAELFCRRWCETSPLDEEGYQALFRVLVKSGRAAEAKRLYHSFEKLLYRELKTYPLPETKGIVPLL